MCGVVVVEVRRYCAVLCSTVPGFCMANWVAGEVFSVLVVLDRTANWPTGLQQLGFSFVSAFLARCPASD